MARFNLACAYARDGAPELALSLIESIAESDHPRRQDALNRARTDTDLDSLRSDQRFIRLIGAPLP